MMQILAPFLVEWSAIVRNLANKWYNVDEIDRLNSEVSDSDCQAVSQSVSHCQCQWQCQRVSVAVCLSVSLSVKSEGKTSKSYLHGINYAKGHP